MIQETFSIELEHVANNSSWAFEYTMHHIIASYPVNPVYKAVYKARFRGLLHCRRVQRNMAK